MVCLLGECHVCRMSSLINAQEVSPDDSLHYIRHLSYTHQVSSQSNSIDKRFQKSLKKLHSPYCYHQLFRLQKVSFFPFESE